MVRNPSGSCEGTLAEWTAYVGTAMDGRVEVLFHALVKTLLPQRLRDATSYLLQIIPILKTTIAVVATIRPPVVLGFHMPTRFLMGVIAVVAALAFNLRLLTIIVLHMLIAILLIIVSHAAVVADPVPHGVHMLTGSLRTAEAAVAVLTFRHCGVVSFGLRLGKFGWCSVGGSNVPSL